MIERTFTRLESDILVACQRLERDDALLGWIPVNTIRGVLPDHPDQVAVAGALKALHRRGLIEFWRSSWPATGRDQSVKRVGS
jgi:hypothetical protein